MLNPPTSAVIGKALRSDSYERPLGVMLPPIANAIEAAARAQAGPEPPELLYVLLLWRLLAGFYAACIDSFVGLDRRPLPPMLAEDAFLANAYDAARLARNLIEADRDDALRAGLERAGALPPRPACPTRRFEFERRPRGGTMPEPCPQHDPPPGIDPRLEAGGEQEEEEILREGSSPRSLLDGWPWPPMSADRPGR